MSLNLSHPSPNSLPAASAHNPGGVPVPPLTQTFWNSPLSLRHAAAGNDGRLRSLHARAVHCAAPPPEPRRLRNQTVAAALDCRRGSAPPGVTLPDRSAMRADRLRGISAGSPGQSLVLRVVGPSLASAGIGSGGRCERGWRGGGVRRGVRTVHGPQKNLLQCTGPRHLGLPAGHINIHTCQTARPAIMYPISPKRPHLPWFPKVLTPKTITLSTGPSRARIFANS